MIAVAPVVSPLGIGELALCVVGELDVLRRAERLERIGALLGLVERVPADSEEHEAHDDEADSE